MVTPKDVDRSTLVGVPRCGLLRLGAPFTTCQGKSGFMSPALWRYPPDPMPCSASWVSLAGLGRQWAGQRVQTLHPAQPPLALFGAPCQRPWYPSTQSFQKPGSREREPKGDPSTAASPLGVAAASAGRGGVGVRGGYSKPRHPWDMEHSPTWHLPRCAAAIPWPNPAPAGHRAAPPPARC